MVVGLAFFLITASRSMAATETQTGQHLLTIHEGDEVRGILTKANTLQDALEQAGVTISSQDLVEPKLSTELVGSNYDVNIYRALPVTIEDGVTQKRVMSPYRVAKQIAAHAEMPLRDEDKTTISSTPAATSDGPGLVLKIDRATEITLTLYGKTITVYSQAKTVGDMLKQKNVKLAADDTVSVQQDAPLTNGMTVEVWRNGVQTVTNEEDVPFKTKNIEDANQPVGYKNVQTPGKNGKKMVTYEVTMKNGQQVDKKEIQSVQTEAPSDEVMIVGSKMTNSFSGSFAEALAKLRGCEGSYTSNTRNGYYGAYQYDLRTWGEYKGYADASQAPAAVQDEKAWITYQARGWSPWPSCSRSQGLQDIYR